MPPTSAQFIYAFDPRLKEGIGGWSIHYNDYEDGQESERNAESPEEALRKMEKIMQLCQVQTMRNLEWQREALCRIAEQMRAVCTDPKYLSGAEAEARAEYDLREGRGVEVAAAAWH